MAIAVSSWARSCHQRFRAGGENSPGATPALVSEAKVQLGVALEKKAEADGLIEGDRKALRQQALGEYLEVVYAMQTSSG